MLNVPPAITSQPADTTICSTVSWINFSVGATGSITGYQWQVSTDGGNNFSNITAATSPMYLLVGPLLPYHNNRYRCQVNSSCTAPQTSYAAVLNVTAFDNMVDDTCKSISCMTCSTDISTIYNTGQYPVVVWTPNNPVNATFGVYKLNVTNSGSCSDMALISVYNNTNNLIRVCPNGKTSITSNLTGATYQWQKRASANNNYPWLNLNSFGSINPTGINSQTLTLPSLTYTYGNQFRCMVDGTNFSDITTIKCTSFWTGAIDSNWFNPNNWSCGIVPDQYQTDVFIYPGKPNYPVINSIVVVRSLTLLPGATITVNAGGKIIITGN